MDSAADRMTEGPISQKIIRFALPLFFGNLFQQLYNLADTFIVGRILGSRSLAAVSSSGSLVFLLVGFFGGLATGGGVVISRYFGAKDNENVHRAVHTSLAVGVAAGLLLTVIGVLLTPQILRWMGTPEDVLPESVAYLRTYFSGVLGMVLYNTCMGIMQAVGDSRHPLQYLIISSVLNVVLDIIMMGILGMGVAGAALATIIAQFTSVILCLIRLTRINDVYRISFKELRFHGDIVKLILRYGLPSGVQNSIISLANVFVQSTINSFGEMAMAGVGAYTRIEGFVFLPITSFTSAITTFVGQNLGAKEFDRTKKGVRFGVLCSISIAELIGVIMFLFAPVLIGAFTSEPEAIEFGVSRARICSLFYFLLALTHCMSAVLRGAGKATVPMFTMFAFWCVVRVGFLGIMSSMYHTMAVVSWVYPLTWSLSSVTLLIYYFRSNWLSGFEKKS